MNVRGKIYNAAQAIIHFSFKPTIDKTGIFVDIYTYIYKQDLRIAPHLLHDYLPIANALGN